MRSTINMQQSIRICAVLLHPKVLNNGPTTAWGSGTPTPSHTLRPVRGLVAARRRRPASDAEGRQRCTRASALSIAQGRREREAWRTRLATAVDEFFLGFAIHLDSDFKGPAEGLQHGHRVNHCAKHSRRRSSTAEPPLTLLRGQFRVALRVFTTA